MPTTSQSDTTAVGAVISINNLVHVQVVPPSPASKGLVTLRLSGDASSIDIVGPLTGPDENPGLYQLVIELDRQLSKLVRPL